MTTQTIPTPERSMTAPAHSITAARSRRARFPLTYARIEIVTSLRRLDNLFFTVLMPLGMYLLFGKMSDFETASAGHGNITASVMISMATYSVAIASTAMAASSAVELEQGWGRQVSLTHGGMRAYLQAKMAAAVVIASLPAVLIFVAGYLTGARIDTPGRWAASLLLCLLAAVPFAVFGLAAGMWFPSYTAVGVASSSVAAFAFLGGVFMPLRGVLFTVAHYTPLYGVAHLAARPLQGDVVATMSGIVHEPLWYSLANLAAWTILFVVACLAARARSTVRK